ncbi:MAG: hypothetical protein IPG98_03300 [Burkholderiales bacterium]|nr:hypothetical protein [Burkholderiales bacterium]
MRAFGLIGLLAALLIVGWLAKGQVEGFRLPRVGATASEAPPGQAPSGTPGPAGQLQQFRQQPDQALQTPRVLPDEAK